MSNRKVPRLFLSGSLLLYSVIFAFPLVILIRHGIAAWGSSTSPTFESLWPVLRFTYLQALASAVLSGIVGVPLAFWLHDRSSKWARALWYSMLIPFSVPGILYALSFIGFWGNRGPMVRALLALGIEPFWDTPYGLIPILVAHTFMNFPIYVRWLGVALDCDGENLERASLALGASRSQTFRHITFPKIRSALAGSFLLAFLYSASSFILVLFLGGNPRFTTLEVALYESVRMIFDLQRASLIALVQLGVFTIVFLFIAWPRRSLVEKTRPSRLPTIYRARSRVGETLGWSLFSLAMLFLVVAPLFNLITSSWGGFGHISTGEWASLLFRSFSIAAGTATLALILSFGLAYGADRARSRKAAVFFEALASLPLAVSTLILGLGILLAFPRRDLGMFSAFPICLVQSIAVLPLTFRAWQQGLRRIPEELRKTATSLGAGEFAVFRHVEAPLLKSAAGLVVALAVSFSLAEMGSMLLFYSQGMETLSVEVYRRMGRYDFDGAYAAGSVLLAAVLVVNGWAGWLEEKLV